MSEIPEIKILSLGKILEKAHTLHDYDFVSICQLPTTKVEGL